jgi:hypothetical protein
MNCIFCHSKLNQPCCCKCSQTYQVETLLIADPATQSFPTIRLMWESEMFLYRLNICYRLDVINLFGIKKDYLTDLIDPQRVKRLTHLYDPFLCYNNSHDRLGWFNDYGPESLCYSHHMELLLSIPKMIYIAPSNFKQKLSCYLPLL